MWYFIQTTEPNRLQTRSQMKRPSPIPACCLLALVLLAGCGAVSPPDAPGGQPTDHSVTLTWKASDGAAHYNVYRSTISGGYYGLIGSTADLAFTDKNVNSGATYYYVCTAVDSAGRESAHSNEASATIQ